MSGLGRPLAAGAAGLTLLVVLLGAAAAGAIGGILGGAGTQVAPSATAISSIPASYLSLYQRAAATCPGLPWTVLAAIGTVESDNGQSTLPGVSAGQNVAGAMVFWGWDPGLWDVSDESWRGGACSISEGDETRGRGESHTGLVACRPDGSQVPGMEGGVAE